MSELDYRDAQIVSLAARVRELEEREIAREGRYQALVQSLDVGIIVRGPQRQITMCNPRALALLGLREDQLGGLSSQDSEWSLVDETGTPLSSCDGLLDACLQRRDSQRMIVGVKRGNGQQPVWLLACVRKQVDHQGELEQVVATFTDVSVCQRRED